MTEPGCRTNRDAGRAAAAALSNPDQDAAGTGRHGGHQAVATTSTSGTGGTPPRTASRNVTISA
ncbi:hypothetical protein AB0C29_28160, partial [Actinoplanes sp. NPDC048791]|uniref:hypothetical protein n=1 Tax=Actinoplanes sp. NPDC048791 TaxID=3154623 RepID=UPI0033ED2DBA